MSLHEELIEKCIDAGAFKAYVLPVDKIPFDEKLRQYCVANYCGSYGKNHACPPSVGETSEVIAKASLYKNALIFQTVANLEDSYDFEGMQEAVIRHSKISDVIGESVKKHFDKYLQLTAGGCIVCPVCSQVEGKPCRLPEKAVSSLEAYCMNVMSLSQLCDMNYINGKDTVTYFGAFLFD